MAYTFKSKNIFITANYYGALTNKRKCFFFIPPWQVLNLTWIVRYLKSYYGRILQYLIKDITKELGGDGTI